MRLADFILSNVEPILIEWEAFARGIAPGAKMDSLALRDHAKEILSATVQDMRAVEIPAGDGIAADVQSVQGGGKPAEGASSVHAILRLGSGFDLLEVVSEYRALRASVLRLWRDSVPAHHDRDSGDVSRFHESIDESVAEAVSSFTRKVDQSRDLFLAILSHDLRNPLNSIAMSAALIPQLEAPDPEIIGCASQITTNAEQMARMIGDLLDYTRTRLGAGMPVVPARMDLEALCRDLFNEFRTAHPDREFRFHADGALWGCWDSDRLRQAISNLMGNAVQDGSADVPVGLTLSLEAENAVVVIHNGGRPIPSGELVRIFDPLVRGADDECPKANRPGSIGLGLYIAREVAHSHRGTIEVSSTEQGGTAFTVRLPLHVVGVSPPVLPAGQAGTI